MNDPAIQFLIDRNTIVETIIRYFDALDDRDFAALRSTLAATVDVDFSLLSGASGAVEDADTFASSVARSLSGAPRTQHINANHVVAIDGDQASATASLYAWHEAAPADDGIGTLRGSYAIGLSRVPAGWRIDKLRMRALWARPTRNVQLAR